MNSGLVVELTAKNKGQKTTGYNTKQNRHRQVNKQMFRYGFSSATDEKNSKNAKSTFFQLIWLHGHFYTTFEWCIVKNLGTVHKDGRYGASPYKSSSTGTVVY
jgi:hypothetical protein